MPQPVAARVPPFRRTSRDEEASLHVSSSFDDVLRIRRADRGESREPQVFCPRRRRRLSREMNVTVRQLFGQDEEHGAVVRLLDEAEQLPAAAACCGGSGDREDDAVAGGDRGGLRAASGPSARPSGRRRGFRSAGLADLLGPSAGEVVSKLPPVQRRALEAALLMGESAPPADERVVAPAFLGSVRLLAAAGPLCVAVDDVQWLDGASLAALRFALLPSRRRASRPSSPSGRRAGVFAARARAAASDDPGRWPQRRCDPRAAPRPPSRHLRAADPAQDLGDVARPTFFALELAAALQRRGGTLPGGSSGSLRPRPAPAGAPRRPQPRGARGYPRGRRACRPDHAARRGAAGRQARTGTDEALAARILELDGAPALHYPRARSAAVKRPFAGALHARLAQRVPTEEERARHLALATAEPSSEIAAGRGCLPERGPRRPTTAAELLRAGTQAHAGRSPRRCPPAPVPRRRHPPTVGDSARATTLLTRARGGRTRRRAGRGARPARGCAVRATGRQAPPTSRRRRARG